MKYLRHLAKGMIRDGMLIKKNCINYEVFIHHSFIESSGRYSSTLKHIEAYSELLRFNFVQLEFVESLQNIKFRIRVK